MSNKMTDKKIKEAVKNTYAKVASSGSCCGTICDRIPFPSAGTALARLMRYDVKNMPKSITESFTGCGNPVALSNIKEGETVLDLGAGAGLDVFIASEKVGSKGKVIGVDMTPEMVEKARKNADKLGLKNVEFRLGDIENLPIENKSIDMIISNCVINLAPDKDRVFREAYRVLRSGGRMLMSDIVTKNKLPKKIRDSISAWTECVAGALNEKEYIQKIKDAGFVDVEIISKTRLGIIYSDKIRAYKPR